MARQPNNVFNLQSIGGELLIATAATATNIVSSQLSVVQSKTNKNIFNIQEETFKQFDGVFETIQTELFSMQLRKRITTNSMLYLKVWWLV